MSRHRPVGELGRSLDLIIAELRREKRPLRCCRDDDFAEFEQCVISRTAADKQNTPIEVSWPDAFASRRDF